MKAGGYGTGGWAVNGDIVIELSGMHDIDIEPPQPGSGGYTSLRDTAQSVHKGKARVVQGDSLSRRGTLGKPRGGLWFMVFNKL